MVQLKRRASSCVADGLPYQLSGLVISLLTTIGCCCVPSFFVCLLVLSVCRLYFLLAFCDTCHRWWCAHDLQCLFEYFLVACTYAQRIGMSILGTRNKTLVLVLCERGGIISTCRL